MNDEEIAYLELWKLKYRRGGPNNSEFLQNWVPREIRSPLLNLQKFQDFEKSSPESWSMHWNPMNDEEFGSIKFLKLKYRRVDQIIQTFCRIDSPRKLVPPSLTCRNFKSLIKKILWIIQNTWKSKEWGRICVLESFKIEIQKGGPKNSAVLQKCLVPPKKSSPSIQVIQLFCKIGFPPHPWKLGPLLNLREFQKTGEK